MLEDAAGDRQLHLACKLTDARAVPDGQAAARRVFVALRGANGDFHNAIRTSAPAWGRR